MKTSRTEYHRQWAKANPDKVKAKRDKYYVTHRAEQKDELNRRRREHYANDATYREKAKIAARAWAAANQEKAKARTVAWVIKYPDRIRVIGAKNRAKRRVRERAITWLTNSQKKIISALYTTAQQMSDATGERYEIDHIIPLQGKLVSGLHVPLNLRIVRRVDNRKKAARFEI